MFNQRQCAEAREFTNRMDMNDKLINSEYEALKPEEKENATNELLSIFTEKNDLPLLDILNISSKYFISEPVLYCLFREHQSRQPKR